jgi:hypothetical protein
VHEQRPLAVQIDDGGIVEELHAGVAREALRHQEVAIAVNEELGQLRPRDESRDARIEGQDEPVVADPVFEEIPEDVERVGAARGGLQEILELRGRSRPRLIEMQVRDEERSSQEIISAFSMTTGSFGTFWWPALLPVATFLILSTVSLPSTTLPNTA